MKRPRDLLPADEAEARERVAEYLANPEDWVYWAQPDMYVKGGWSGYAIGREHVRWFGKDVR